MQNSELEKFNKLIQISENAVSGKYINGSNLFKKNDKKVIYKITNISDSEVPIFEPAFFRSKASGDKFYTYHVMSAPSPRWVKLLESNQGINIGIDVSDLELNGESTLLFSYEHWHIKDWSEKSSTSEFIPKNTVSCDFIFQG